ncbi:MAG: hypothetical protein B7Z71_03870 [Acidocella sp. 21-58-7]|nr:MAG: hypothetical protein B7Z71_03870 [Acidocella sp. 21-58-7]
MSGSSQSFLDQFPDPVAPPAPLTSAQPTSGSANFLDQFPDPVAQSSAVGAFVRGAAQGALPAVGGLAAAGAGAEAGGAAGAGIGAEIGGALGVAGGPLAELTVPAGAATGAGIGGAIGGFAGGLAGFFGGSAVAQSAQNYALKQMPDNWQDALGASDRQQRVDQEQHPIASFLGGLAPYAITMSPGALTAKAANLPADATAFQRIMANPLTSRLFGGAAMGGMQIGQEEYEGQPINWTQAAIATGFGMVFNKPNAFGEKISSAGENAARSLFGIGTPMTVPPPTLAESADAKVMGPGITEAVFQGQQQQDPAAEQAAQAAASVERSLTGEQPAGPDLNAVARQMHPELFAQYDDLQQQQATLSQWINEAKNPPDDQVQAAQERPCLVMPKRNMMKLQPARPHGNRAMLRIHRKLPKPGNICRLWIFRCAIYCRTSRPRTVAPPMRLRAKPCHRWHWNQKKPRRNCNQQRRQQMGMKFKTFHPHPQVKFNPRPAQHRPNLSLTSAPPLPPM